MKSNTWGYPIGTHGWYTCPLQWLVPGSTRRPASTGCASECQRICCALWASAKRSGASARATRLLPSAFMQLPWLTSNSDGQICGHLAKYSVNEKLSIWPPPLARGGLLSIVTILALREHGRPSSGTECSRPCPCWKMVTSSALDRLVPAQGSFDVLQMEQWCLQGASEMSEARGLQLNETCRLLLARCIGRVIQRASLQLKRLADGEPLETDTPFGAPRRAPSRSSRGAVVFSKLVEGWTAERRPAPKTVYEWQRVIKQLVSFLGHENASALTADDLLRWKSSMVEAGLRPKTVRDAKLAPVRAILQWGVQNQLLAENVAEKITIDVRAKQGEKKRSFTDDEGRIILRAALSEKDPVRRWVPWIGAYSGARVSEICQLRREDIVEIEGIWCMKVMPEAGSVKTSGSERVIPLHPALVASGFLEFAAQETRRADLFGLDA